MSEWASIDAFLSKPRLGMLTTNRPGDAPIAVPVWFEWDGSVVRMFTSATSPKIGRLEHDAKASLLVANDVDEREAWVAFDGSVEISEAGGFELAERLAPRYWDLTDPERKETLETWGKGARFFRLLTLTPDAVRTTGAVA